MFFNVRNFQIQFNSNVLFPTVGKTGGVYCEHDTRRVIWLWEANTWTGPGEQDPSSPNRAGRNAGTRGPSQARERADPSKVDVLSLLPHLSLYLRKSPGIR